MFGQKQVVGPGYDNDEVPTPAVPPVLGGVLDAYLGGGGGQSGGTMKHNELARTQAT